MANLRFYGRLALMALGLIVCVPLHYLMLLSVGHSVWPRRFLGFVGRCAGLRVHVDGLPLRRHVLFAANHVSWLDILAMAGASGTAFVAKGDIQKWPLIGWLCRLNDTVFVDRAARGSVHGQADALRRLLATGRSVALFPEGTTGNGHEVQPFRASLFASVFPPLEQLRVQPVAIDYGALRNEIAWVGDEPAGANARRLLSRRGTIPVLLTFCAPIDPHDAADRKALSARARGEVVAALGASESAPHAV